MSADEEISLCRRREPRQSIQMGAVAFRRDGSRWVVALSDISYEGCQFRGSAGLSADEAISLLVPDRGGVGARVRWVANDRAGANFDASVEPLVVPDLTAMRFGRSYNYGSGRVFGRKGVVEK